MYPLRLVDTRELTKTPTQGADRNPMGLPAYKRNGEMIGRAELIKKGTGIRSSYLSSRCMMHRFLRCTPRELCFSYGASAAGRDPRSEPSEGYVVMRPNNDRVSARGSF